MRPVCRRCRDALLNALARQLPCLQPAGVSAWLRLVTWLPPYLDEVTVAGATARAGAGIERMTPYRISPPVPVVSSSATRPSTSRPSLRAPTSWPA
jgi:GntR family transcriptional regulator / MocR family aminotransferase